MKVEQGQNLSPGTGAQSTTTAPTASRHQLRRERGRAARRVAPRSSHAGWAPAPDRPDPVALLEEQARDRLPELLPIRYSRMMASPFAFMRGSAIVMQQLYGRTLQEDRRHLPKRYRFVDAARKVVGVGSVGTRDYVVLLEGDDEDDPLILQVKEAEASALQNHLPKSA